MSTKEEKREAILQATYGCLAASGLSATSLDDVAQAAGVSRATLYRYFPGGRDDLVSAVVTWEYRRFFIRLYNAVKECETLEQVIETGLVVAHQAISDHEVLQMILRGEPGVLEPTLVAEAGPTREQIALFLTPYLEREELRDGCDIDHARQFLARMVLSYISAPGQWNFDDPEEVRRLVRSEFLGGILPEPTSLTMRQI
jgi:AcrR family transcriptional regulator